MKVLSKIKAITMCFTLCTTFFFLEGCVQIEGGSPEEENFESWQDEMHYKIDINLDETVKNTDTKHRTWYEVFVYSFNDTNGDGIGDLNGVTEMLDYIEYMGFSGIWLTPINPSTTYHKYDVTDYYSVDPQYGTLEDFERLAEECEKRDIAIILDMVINHTSSKHEWFVEAASAARKGDYANKYLEYYNFADEAGNGQWKAVGELFYECQFWSEMPDLNLENTNVREELEKVFEFWLNKGAKGFRLDAAKEYVSGNTEKNVEILSWVNKSVKAVKPDAYLVAEVWEANTGLYDYYRSGIDSFFNFNFSAADGKLAKTLLNKNQTAKSYAEALLSAREKIQAQNTDATDAPFFTNHDTARASGFLRRDSNLIKLAWGMNLTQSGNAFVYYGEEIGMLGAGEDPDKRAPMHWYGEKAAGITYGPPGMNAKTHEFAPATEQIGDENSILEYIRKAVTLRNKYPAVAGGEITAIKTEYGDRACAVYKSYNGEENCLFYNFSDENISISAENPPLDWLSPTGEEPVYLKSEQKLTLPPYSIIIF